jgi:replicative DNA helicase
MGLFHDVLHSTHIDRAEARRPAWLKAPDRATPAAVDSERLLLGALLLDPAQMLAVIEVLPPGHNWFHQDANRLVYDAMLTLFERRDLIDLQTVTDGLYRRGHLEKIAGSLFLAEHTESVASTVNTAHHARLLREKAMYRTLINLSTEIAASAYEQADLPDILGQAHEVLLHVSQSQSTATFSAMPELMTQAIHDAQQMDGHELTGINTGFDDLNREASGWKSTDLIILAARPGMGKTALAL